MLLILPIFMLYYCGFHFVSCHDRIAPGIHPQHYQQPSFHQDQNINHMPQQHVQYQAPQQQQVPPQMQQMPNMQQHIPAPQMQQIPNTQQHIPAPQMQQMPNMQHIPTHEFAQPQDHSHGHHHKQPQQILHTNIAEEKEHIAEHLPIDTSKMSTQELQFHYFKIHDADSNDKLDGCELIKSLIHWHEENKHEPGAGEKIFADEELSYLIDPILDLDDYNKDGYIDYPEFIRAQQKTATSNQ